MEGRRGGDGKGVYCAKSSRPSQVDGRNESGTSGTEREREAERVKREGRERKLGSKYGPVSPAS